MGAGVGEPYFDADDSVARVGDVGSGEGGTGPVVNDLGGLVRRKKRSATTTTTESTAKDRGMSEANGEKVAAAPLQPGVNVLGGGMVRKKVKTNV
jgi:hypothetical protein